MLKRVFDVVISLSAITVFLLPMLLISVLILLDSKGPVFFRQIRIGSGMVPFRILKFRTMITHADRVGAAITVSQDNRVTKIGRYLRRYKLDELPQLFNVLNGAMSLVGPRPEVPEFVKYYTDEDREIIFSVKPGITDSASIAFRHENEMLANAENVEQVYVDEILPEKLVYYRDYARKNSFLSDIAILVRTFWAIVFDR